MRESVVILHLSDLHFAESAGAIRPERLARLGRVFARSLLIILREREVPDDSAYLVIVTGDITESGTPSQFTAALFFFNALRDHLNLPSTAFVFVPGNHDVSWIRSQIAELVLRDRGDGDVDDEELRRRIDRAKFKHFDDFVRLFYGSRQGLPDRRNVTVSSQSPPRQLRIYDFRDLSLSVAAMNSCERESHRDGDHIGEVSDQQAQLVLDVWRRCEYDSWVKVVAVHHNPVVTTPANIDSWKQALRTRQCSEDLIERFCADVTGCKGSEHIRAIVEQTLVQLVLHGHHHASKSEVWRSVSNSYAHVLSTGQCCLDPSLVRSNQPPTSQLIHLDLRGDNSMFTAYPLVYSDAYPLDGEIARGRLVQDTRRPPLEHQTLHLAAIRRHTKTQTGE